MDLRTGRVADGGRFIMNVPARRITLRPCGRCPGLPSGTRNDSTAAGLESGDRPLSDKAAGRHCTQGSKIDGPRSSDPPSNAFHDVPWPMSHTYWFLLIGTLLLGRGLAPKIFKGLPATPAIVYLIVGLLLGPSGMNLFYFDPFRQSALLEVLTEVAVLISLFSAGIKMPVPVRIDRWSAPIRLAGPGVAISVALVAAFAVLALGYSWGAAILLGAILSPTDPVLATDVQSRHPGDKDDLRFALTCEAGMNDGTAFPFVMLGLGLLGLHEMGPAGSRWFIVDAIWATAAAIIVGVLLGTFTARIGWRWRGLQGDREILDDLVGLGLIALVYGLADSVSAYGFLAVFFAGVALRQTELGLARKAGIHPSRLDDTSLGPRQDTQGTTDAPTVLSTNALIFKEHLERLSELLLVLLLGGMMFLQFWNWRTLALAGFVLLIARPLSTVLSLVRCPLGERIRPLACWFGVRGIGSVYYLVYAIQQGVPPALARDMIQLVLIVITLSILLHGASVKPLMDRFWARS